MFSGEIFSRLKGPVPSPVGDFHSIFSAGAAFDTNAATDAERYQSNDPFAHIVIDNLFDAPTLREMTAEVPSPLISKDLFTRDVKGLQEYKFAWRDVPRMGALSLRFISHLGAKPFLEYLTKLTGIEGLMPDPYLWGGGFHQILRGGKLAVHADFNIQPQTKLYRRLNLLVYLNEGWEDAWGGHLELWSKDMQRCVQTVAPVFNRTVIFSTTQTSYHGHPDPLLCPEQVVRKSLALYYYTYDRLMEDTHSTLWKDRPQDGTSVAQAVDASTRKPG